MKKLLFLMLLVAAVSFISCEDENDKIDEFNKQNIEKCKTDPRGCPDLEDD